jgi:hypothetical protein
MHSRLTIFKARILCRLPDNTNEIQEIGRLFRSSRFGRSQFVFREEGCVNQIFETSSRAITSKMISSSCFRLPEFGVYLTKKTATVYAAIRFATQQEYSLSGFPRQLVLESGHNSGNLSPL